MSRTAIVRELSAAIVVGLAAWGLADPAFGTMWAPSHDLAWTSQIGTSSNDYGQSVAVDSLGNVYLAGYTSGSLGGTNAGSTDIFLTKYDSAGGVTWSRQAGTSHSDYGYSVACDSNGNAYLTGHTFGNLGGTNAGSTDVFLIKYNSLGTQLWAKQVGSSGSDYSYSMAVDASGNAYLTGSTFGSLCGTNAGNFDAFLLKYNSSGAQIWARQFGTSSADSGYSTTVDATGNTYVAGYTFGSLGGTNVGYSDALLVKYNSSGTQLWAKQVGSSSSDYCYSVATDASGNTYIGGKTSDALPGCSSAGNTDAFLIKYDSSGNRIWTEQFGTSSADSVQSVAVSSTGSIYVAGTTTGSLAGTSAGGSDAFLMEYDSSGNQLWAKQLGTSSDDIGYAAAVDASGNAYTAGYTAGSLGGTNAGSNDAFVMKFLAPVPEPSAFALLTTAVAGLLTFARRRR